MKKEYRIFAKIELTSKPLETIYTLIQGNGRRIRVSLPRRPDWEVGDTVKIEEAVVIENLVE